MNQSEQSHLAVQSLFAAIADSVAAACSLPSVPTHDWTTSASQALARVAPSGRASVMLVEHNAMHGSNRDTFRIESVGVAITGAGMSVPQEQDTVMRMRLERVNECGFPLSDEMRSRGVVGRLGTLNSAWRESKMGHAWANQGMRDVLFAIVPLKGAGRNAAMICMIGDAGNTIPIEGFGSVVTVLHNKAQSMLERMDTSGGYRWLTVREQEVLDELVKGHSVREIADELGRSRHTVHDHVKSLHKKIHASSRGELVSAALGRSNTESSAEQLSLIYAQTTSMIEELKPSGAGAASIIASEAQRT